MPNLSLENANLECLASGFTISSRYQKAFITFQSQLSLRQIPFGSAVTGHLESCLSCRQLNKMTEGLSIVGIKLAGFGEVVGGGCRRYCPGLSNTVDMRGPWLYMSRCNYIGGDLCPLSNPSTCAKF